jgi:hypothetical protein
MRTYKIQPAAFTDQVTDDGEQLTKKPYPIVVRENGEIVGSPLHVAVIGFVRDLARQEVDMPWSGVLVAGRPIYPVVGSYVIVQDRKGRWSTLATAVESFEPLPDERRDPGELEGGERSRGVHASHCCIRHGCKYGDPHCPVAKTREVEQEYDCEQCDDDAEAQPVSREELRKLLADFAAEVGMDLEAERLDWGPGTEQVFERLAEKLGIRR